MIGKLLAALSWTGLVFFGLATLGGVVAWLGEGDPAGPGMTMVMLSFTMLFGFFLLRRRENRAKAIASTAQAPVHPGSDRY
ncbi:hypothetical protein [Lolliginicoccus levis]|uniref:hypothetical protein n=1 Tax=Lolliginicoccus levis TaxID=2919542 RepID=UPI00241FE703|nr:hypothetical protein [Lolliginicoccus levis]